MSRQQKKFSTHHGTAAASMPAGQLAMCSDCSCRAAADDMERERALQEEAEGDHRRLAKPVLRSTLNRDPAQFDGT